MLNSIIASRLSNGSNGPRPRLHSMMSAYTCSSLLVTTCDSSLSSIMGAMNFRAASYQPLFHLIHWLLAMAQARAARTPSCELGENRVESTFFVDNMLCYDEIYFPRITYLKYLVLVAMGMLESVGDTGECARNSSPVST